MGARKSLCERVVETHYGDKSLIIRPGVLVGPHESVPRFAYWLHRLASGGEVLAPGLPKRRFSFWMCAIWLSG